MIAHDVRDELIDAAACGMTAGEPPLLAAAVTARLEARPSPGWVMRYAGLAAAVLGCWFLVSHGLRDHVAPDIPSPPALASLRTAPAERTALEIESSPRATQVAPSQRPVAQRAQAVASPETAAARAAFQAGAVPALEAPAPLVVAAIQPEGLEVRPLDAAPLTVPAISESGVGQ